MPSKLGSHLAWVAACASRAWPRTPRAWAGVGIGLATLVAVGALWQVRTERPAPAQPPLPELAVDTVGMENALGAVRRAWYAEFEGLRRTARRYATNDETVDFLRSPNVPFVERWFPHSRLADLGLDTVLIVDPRREPIFWRRVDDPANRGFPDAEEFLAGLPAFDAGGARWQRGEPVLEGVVQWSRGPTLVSIVPVLRPGESRPRGFLVVGRSFDGATARRLVEQAPVAITALPRGDARLPANVVDRFAESLTPVLLVDSERVRGYLPLNDARGRLLQVYSAALPRPIRADDRPAPAPIVTVPWPLLIGGTLLLLLAGGTGMWWAWAPARRARERERADEIERLARLLAREAEAAHGERADTAADPAPYAPRLRPRHEADDAERLPHERVAEALVQLGATADEPPVPEWISNLDVTRIGDDVERERPRVGEQRRSSCVAPADPDEAFVVVGDDAGSVGAGSAADTREADAARAPREEATANASSTTPEDVTIDVVVTSPEEVAPAVLDEPASPVTPTIPSAQSLRDARLRELADAGRLHVHYQPQIRVATQEVVGVEALLRWDPQDGSGVLQPASTLFEGPASPDLYVAATEFVLRQACADRRYWLRQVGRTLPVAVNVGAGELRDPGFLDRVLQVLADTDLAPAFLELEVPESVLARPDSPEAEALEGAYRRGLGIAIGGFVAADAPLRAITQVPVAKLKVHRSLVAELPHESHSRAVVDAILAVGRTLGVAVCAEGVETQEQAQYLENRHCPLAQGWHYGRPMDAERFLELLKGSGVDTVSLPLMDAEELERHARAAGLA